jgi:glycerol-3-phosphate dehydrogenase (NAD(P)+)
MNFAILGAGAWGTALAIHLSRLNHTVTLVPRRFEHALAISSARENKDYLPGAPLPLSLQLGHEIAPVVMETDVVLLACPAQALRATCEQLRANLGLATQLKKIISVAKGLELGTHLRTTQIISSIFPEYGAGVLTGPTNAAEFARGLPAAMLLAVDRIDEFTTELQAALSGPSLRVYTSEDLAGAEFGSCLKNIYAIAAGCCDGLRFGDNTKAALLTRALTEMMRVGQALGAQPQTFYGLSGAGDLIATCYGQWSRNREFGQRIGEGRRVAELIENRKTVVEGYKTTESFYGLCQTRKIEAPILTEVYRMLYENRSPAEALSALMTRELKREG